MTSDTSELQGILRRTRGIRRVGGTAWFVAKRLAVFGGLFLWLRCLVHLAGEQSLGLSVVLAWLYDGIQDVRWSVARARDSGDETVTKR